ncbi:MAG: DinB family protein [Chitinophagaceae bacterium]|nr:MAG: DinB family protein [Chitinophagaceae bacterium]
MTADINQIMQRDLDRLTNEISSYQDERIIWHIEKGIANSAGNLCLHLIGNLNTYIGKELGGTSYVRVRELEFSKKSVPRDELLKMIRDTKTVIQTTLEHLTPEQLAAEFPALVFDTRTSTSYMLIHLIAHLNYHLGQVNYHRRLLDHS